MTKRTYPYKAWILMPSFKPVEVEFVREYVAYSRPDYGDITHTGKVVRLEDIYPTKDVAIATGLGKLNVQQINLDERQTTIFKRRNALTKATK